MTRPTTQPILRSVNRLVATIPAEKVTPSVEVHIELARNLARRLDDAGTATSGAVAQAVPAITKQLATEVEHILQVKPEPDAFLAGLFAGPDGIDVRIRSEAVRITTGTEDDVA